MNRTQKVWAVATAAMGLGAGLAAQRSVVKRRRRDDPEGGEKFGERRGIRQRNLDLPDGARLFIEEAGPEVRRGAVFVHGSALRSDVWHYQLPGLNGHRLVFYDLRGHGRSQPKGKSDFSIAVLADDLATVIDASELDEAVIVGHSIGAFIALQLACTRPDLLGTKVKGLVLSNATYRPAAETIAGGEAIARIERITRRPFDVLGRQHARIEQLRKMLRPSDTVFLGVSLAAFGPGASASQIDFTYDMVSETSMDVLFGLVRAYRDYDVSELLDAVTVPTLIIAGTHDRLTVASAAEYLAEHLPKAELEVLEGCGHMPMLERHERFNRLVAKFLDEVLGGPEPRDQDGMERST
ncbi:MAG: alpha/beta hydrolase [Actinomycetota bacterium]|nr:alpha/beta hydrolase [Actinomycetota bacterium]